MQRFQTTIFVSKRNLFPWPQINFCDVFRDHVTYSIGVLRVKKNCTLKKLTNFLSLLVT